MWYVYLLIFGLLCSTMLAQNLRLLSPNGSEVISIDSEILIQWEGVQDSNLVKLEYSIDNGISWNVIAIGRWSSYVWKNLPQTPSSQCLIVRTKLKTINGIIDANSIYSVSSIYIPPINKHF